MDTTILDIYHEPYSKERFLLLKRVKLLVICGTRQYNLGTVMIYWESCKMFPRQPTFGYRRHCLMWGNFSI